MQKTRKLVMVYNLEVVELSNGTEGESPQRIYTISMYNKMCSTHFH